jgi:hypothetical protein
MSEKKIDELVHSDLRTLIEYEWTVLGGCYQKRFIRGIYSSLTRLLDLYKQKDFEKEQHNIDKVIDY